MWCCGGIAPCGSCSRPQAHPDMYILVTLCRFDQFYHGEPNSGPFIPTQRRLANMEYLEIQGHDIWTGFLEQGAWQAS